MSKLLHPLLLASALASCAAFPSSPSIAAAAPITSAEERSDLVARPGWSATLVHESDSGIWNTGTLDCFPLYGFPEIYALDDKGRCTILVGYSGTYSANLPFQEREWLGDLEPLQLEQPAGEPEFYTGGKRGVLYQVRAHGDASFDTRVLARFPGEEIHILAGGELDPAREGRELLVFTHPGNVYLLRADLAAHPIANVGGRVRQTIQLPCHAGEAPWLAAVTRAGDVLLLQLAGDTLTIRTLAHEPCGFGRIALAPTSRPGASVLYATRDDGLVLRFEQGASAWRREAIYAGPQGPRGVAAGRFDADPAVETVAVFGYSGKVELLSRRAGQPWNVETLLTDRDKGHWLEAAELDGRNGTDELLCSGYGKRVLLLAREPGYGLATTPSTASVCADPAPSELRVGVFARPEALSTLSPLSYRGGFETKTWTYETLVTRDARGRLTPGLAQAWRVEDGGRRWTFQPRTDACWQDGTPVTADSLRAHVLRWIGLPESEWLGAARLIRDVATHANGELSFELATPWFLPGDLCAINPTAAIAPAAFDAEGRFAIPLGSGPFRLASVDEAGRRARYAPCRPGLAALDVRCFDSASPRTPLAQLLAGELDLIADGWYRLVPRDEAAALARDPRFELLRVRGSIVRYLAFAGDHGPTAELALRRAVASAIDRAQLVREVEVDFALPCSSLFAPGIEGWSALTIPAAPTPADTRLVLVAARGRDEALAACLARQLERLHVALEVRLLDAEALERAHRAGDFDLRFAESYGLPYDPDITLQSVFHGPRGAHDARTLLADRELDLRLDALAASVEPDERALRAAAVSDHIAAQALLVPLFASDRLALVRRGAARPRLDADVYRLTFEPCS